MRRFRLAARVVGFLLVAFGCAQGLHAAVLLRDVNKITAGSAAYVALNAVDLDTSTLFVFDDGIHGAELWATDGTPAGTHMVLDINPGPAPSQISSLVVAQGIAYFWADDGTNGLQLWKSNGTAAGTTLVADIRPVGQTVDGPFGPPIVAIGSVVYFVANDGKSGVELWRSDGTSAGTYLLSDIAPGAASSNPDQLTVVGSRLFFVADDGSAGQELWSTDGTPAGTRIVQDINPGSNGSSPHELLEVGGLLFFVANTAAQGTEVWRAAADGASASIVQDIVPGPARSYPSGLTNAGSGVLFAEAQKLYWAGASGGALAVADLGCSESAPIPESAMILGARTLFQISLPSACVFPDPPTHTDFWTTDGTPGGTGRLNPNEGIISPYDMAVWAPLGPGKAYFLARSFLPGTITPDTPINVWVSDGTLAGTQKVTAFSQSINSLKLVKVGRRLYFTAGGSFDPAGQEVWSTDGTPGGTTLLADINPGSANSNPDQLVLARGKLLFTADDGIVGREPWISDGTASGTLRLWNAPVVQATGDGAGDFYPFGSGAILTADDGVSGRELWFSDGTPNGTLQLADIAPGPAASTPQNFVTLPGQVLFIADDGSTGRELWRTDGTVQGTRRVADINPGAGSSDPMTMGAVVLNGVAYFGANDGINGLQLWRSDGTAAGTFLFKSIAPPDGRLNFYAMGTIGGRALFGATDGTAFRLWATDGTVAGTAPVRTDMTPGDVRDSATFGGFIYFQGTDSTGDAELWRTDGTAAGTTRVQDLLANGSSSPHGFSASNAALLFSACLGGPSCATFATRNGTSVQQLGEVQVNGPVVTDGARFFFIDGSIPPSRLVVSDGTSAGTAYLQGNLPFTGDITQYTWFSGSLVMTVEDSALGPSVWASDGTAAGTHLLADIDPGTTVGRDPGGFLAVGSKLFFSAYRPDIGLEPWVIEAATPNADDDSIRVPFETATRIKVLANDGDLGNNLERSSVEIVTQPTLGAAVVDSATGEIVYTPDAGRSGVEVIQYRVQNGQGNSSNVANVLVMVAAPPGPAPGSAPSSPSSPPPSSTSSRSGGGGGTIDLIASLALGLALAKRQLRRRAAL